ncbi:hypothetical protein PVAND_015815 [Polypedilum vanderplanki]|uniref:Ankyrin repeat protein n=1 Tax=Polypedilum vanderplanki TaxID=319348 RepID=A0A9J6BE86_POLVA|nr:hypothetical protein PVAND_015815 [Polypedilum vanderplanki]
MPQRSINSKYIIELPYSSDQSANILAGTAYKLVRISSNDDHSHPTMREAIDLITSETFSTNFLKANRAFVINIQCRGSLLPLNAAQVTQLQCYKDRSMIFFFESKESGFCCLYKDKNILKFITNVSKIFIEEFRESEFSFELMLRALRSNYCGKFNGKLLETQLSVAPLDDEWRLIYLAVLSNNLLCIRFLQLFENFLASIDNFSINLLQSAVQSCDYDSLLALFDLNFESQKEMKLKINKKLLNIKDENGFNLLMIAVDSKNVDATRFLLNLEYFDVNEGVDESITPASLACKTNNSTILLMLLQNDSKYPKNYLKIQKTQELEMFCKKIAEFHRSIATGDLRSARDFICSLKLQYYYNEQNKSAAMTAIENRQFKIYEILLINKSSLAPHEDPSTLNLDFNDKKHLRIIHDRYSNPLYEKCVLDVEKKIQSVNIAEKNRQKFQFELSQALNCLYDVEIFRPVLQIVAASEIKILVDFDRNSVKCLDPSESASTRGYYANDTIYIGSKELLFDNLRHLFLATIIHEMTHFVIDFLYQNFCRPFVAGDEKREKDFREVVEACRRVSAKEKIVDVVFSYHESLHYSELIVRPNHLIAHYYDNEEMQKECEKNFPELFAFYKERIYGDMLNRLESMEGRDLRGLGWSRKRKYADNIYKDRVVDHETEILIDNFEIDEKFERKEKKLFWKILFVIFFSLVFIFGLFALKFSQNSENIYAVNFDNIEHGQNLAYNNAGNQKIENFNSKDVKILKNFEKNLKESGNLHQILSVFNENESFIPHLNFSSCSISTHPNLNFIFNKNISALKNHNDQIKNSKSDLKNFWKFNEKCNFLTLAIEKSENDFDFIENVFNVAELTFDDCENNLKIILVKTLKHLKDENFKGDKIVNFLKEKLNKLLNVSERRNYLNGNLELDEKNC